MVIFFQGMLLGNVGGKINIEEGKSDSERVTGDEVRLSE